MSAVDVKKSKQKWNAEEDEQLRQLVASVGDGTPDWVRISQYFRNRTPKQCRERWANHVSPRVEKGPWSLAEELVLFQVQALQGNRWKEIAQYLHGRSESCVKNRYYSALRRVMRRRGVKPEVAKELMKEHFMPGAETTLQLLRQGYSIDAIYEQQKKHLTPDYLHGEFQSQQAVEPPVPHDGPPPSQPGAPLSYINSPNMAYSTPVNSSGPVSMHSSFMPPNGGTANPYHSHVQSDMAQGRDTVREIGFVRERVQGVELSGGRENIQFNGYGGYSGSFPPVPEEVVTHSRDKRQSVPHPVSEGTNNKQRRVMTSDDKFPDSAMNDFFTVQNGVSNGSFSLRQGGPSSYYPNVATYPSSRGYESTGTDLLTGVEAMRNKQSIPTRYSGYDMMSSAMSTDTNPGHMYSSSRSASISWAESLQQHPYSLHNKSFSSDGNTEKVAPPAAEEDHSQHMQGLGSPDPCTHPEDQ
eukprot:gb/GECG01014847.1/.p1 GENE.gb/GECG01014847.1/~~gb/GECG01014847.1/.p1  ORF type:complete len:469 (+),score=52.09 gb/GECG01014847.1/:1-1407(+)